MRIALLQTDADTLQSNYSAAFTNLGFATLASWNIIPAGFFDPSILPKLPFQAVTMSIASELGYQQWAAASSANEWTLVPAISLRVTNIGFGLQRTLNPLSGGYDTSFWLTGTFLLGKQTNLTVSVAVPVSASAPAGQWRLNLSSTATLADGIADLSQLVFGNNLFATLPPGFQQATSFRLDQLLLTFSLEGGGTVSYAKIMIGRPADQPWTIVDGFTVTGAGANFTLNKATSRYTVATYLFAKFAIGGGSGTPAKAYLNVSLDVPAGSSDWVAHLDGSLQNTNGIGDLFSSLPASNGYALPAFPVGLQLQEINLEQLNIAFNPASKTLSSIQFSVTSVLEFDIFGILSVRDPYVALDIRNPTLSQQRTLTGTIGGTLEIGGVSVKVVADKPVADAGWTFSAGMQPGAVIPLLDLVKKFLKPLGIETLPDWVNKASLNISGVAVSMYVPTAAATDQSKKYHVEGTVKWKIDVNSFALPKALDATVSLDYINGNASGSITVVATLLLLPFKLGYKFGTPATEVYLEWLGIQADYKHNSTTMVDVITITFANMSVGEIITHLIQSFDPGFALSPPWDVLNSINLSGLSLKYTNDKNTPDNSKIEIVYAKAINLGFLQIDQITITKDKTGVFLGFKGKFLGVEISSTAPDPAAQKLAGKGSDVRDLDSIPVPGMGTQFFDLDYLGMGQRVALYPFQDLKTVDQAISNLKDVFLPPAPPAPGKPPILPIKPTPKVPAPSATLVFSEESSWLIATKFTIIEAITLGVVFNDPNLYGLLVKLDGEKMQALSGLSFQILYKKVTDSVGVYQIELKLPDSIRELQFGAVSVTLPVIGIDVYTNGSFRLDFGFPANMDFSRSLTVQAFPFTGSGGFYIAYLHDVPSDKVPKTTRGIFNPIVELGLGLQLGIGKSINKGILKAGFSVTVIGIFEGVIAFFKSNSGTPSGSGDTYYKVSATVGLVGKLYGEVNFAIISASVDITVYAYVQMVVEAYRKIPIYLEAGVSVSLRVSVNLGLFKIHINLRFSTTISASFTIGSDSQAPWDLPATNQRRLLREAAAPALVLTWDPLVLTAQEQASERLSLYFFPQLTASSDSTSKAVQFCNLLYIDAPENGSTTDASLNRLVKGVLYWCINAAINSGKSGITLEALKSDTVSYDVLKQLHAYLSDTSTNPSPIPYANIEAFLKAYFTISIADTNEAAERHVGTGEPLNASIFPIFPMLQVSWALNGTSHDLSTSTVDSTYMSAVQEALRKLRVDYQNPAEMAQDKLQETGHGLRSAAPKLASGQALSTFIFQDYILMLARSAVQDAVNELEKFAAPFGSNDSLYTIAAAYNELTYTHGESIDTNDVTVAGLAAANSSLLFRQGLLLEIPSVSHQVRAGDTLQRVADQYHVSVPALATGGNTAIQGLVTAGTLVQVAGFDDYRIGVGQTLDQVAAGMTSASGGTHPTTDQVLQAVKDQPLLSLAKLVLPTLTHSTGAADSFESVALLYGVSIATLADNDHNAKQQGLFSAGVTSITIPSLQVLNVKTVVDTFDTSDNIARISGMAARYFLHGMRLPVPGQLSSTAPLYGLSGQQFPLPVLKAGDALSIRLGKTGDTTEPCFIQLNGSCATTSLDIPITEADISRIQSLAAVPFDPGATPLPLPLGKTTGQTFTLKPGINWQYPGTLALPVGTPPAQLTMRPSIWPFSEALMNKLEALQATDLGLSVLKLVRQSEQGGFDKQPVYNGFATLLDFSIQQVQGLAGAEASANVYEIIGAGDTGIVLLERLIRHINKNNGDDSFIDQIRVLYPADPTGDAPVGLQSAVDGGVTIALVQANLSTETNPSGPMLFRQQEAAPRNTLNEFKQFVSFLWQCSIVRTGGYFLYYKTADGAGLPPSLFSQGKTAKVQLLVTYKEDLSAAFVNSVAIGEPIDSATTTVYVEATHLNTLVAVAGPGNAGFELERTKPDEYVPINPYPIPADDASKHQDLNYLNYQFNLIGYALLETDVFEGAYSLLPVGPTHDPAADGASPAFPPCQTAASPIRTGNTTP
ncbi:LysM peptidoglycan-binding domain-containing protein [Hymenobacter cellulosilyticus]|uniref:LysM peptidoglycan-binding domain-containing protein n=1 Tax=Hymenobacter cellulosilyticus TaxID=2932248 RepID=A0A8T9Q014_9BACT|nr:LysM domain-containing protein [Hymenobacter cellulosilyticus]UOQ70182.1 LysM peptidoglycan-binding domain-containing protein [Hymenobacter cellulosilyticus]